MIKPISENQRALAYELLRVLRPRLSREDFDHIYENSSKNDQYKLVGYYDNERLVGVVGFRVLYGFGSPETSLHR